MCVCVCVCVCVKHIYIYTYKHAYNSLVHQFVNKWNFDQVKMHGTNVKKK